MPSIRKVTSVYQSGSSQNYDSSQLGHRLDKYDRDSVSAADKGKNTKSFREVLKSQLFKERTH
jgi:hypothetical protein